MNSPSGRSCAGTRCGAGMLAAALAIVPAGIGWWVLNDQPAFPLDGVVLGLISGTVEAGYFILLSAAYRRGDLFEKRRRLMQDWARFCAAPAPERGAVVQMVPR